jgi:hypothetical protein
VSTAEVGMFTVSDLPDAPPARSVSSREAALSEIARIDALRAQGLALTPETDAAYDEAVALVKTDTTALIEKVKEAAEAVRYDQEIRDAQGNVADRVARLESSLGALAAIRSDDKAARLAYKRAVNAALNAGVSQADIVTIPAEVSKMPDVNGWPGCGEGAWTTSWGRS